MRFFYSLLLYALLPLILLKLLYRSIRNPAYRHRILERFGVYNKRPETDGIWVHAVSVGEVIAAIKLIKALRLQYPDRSITVTCGTPTGSEIIQKQLGSSVFHVYAPYDLPGSVKRFLKKCQPVVGIIMETEIWPNLLYQASKSGARLLISNMRLSETSFRRYQKFPKLVSQSLGHIDQFAVQTEKDAQRAISLGADKSRVDVVGNLKFDMDTRDAIETSGSDQLKSEFASERSIWLAGSTHEGEDEIALRVHAELLKQHQTLLLILVPRHPERFSSVFQLCNKKFKCQKRSELNSGGVVKADTQVLLVDTIGELSRLISITDWVFIGGSLVPVGGHNILEACQASVPVLFGGYMSNFSQIAQVVTERGAGIQVFDESGLLQACLKLSQDAGARRKMGDNGLALMQLNQGATQKTMKLLSAWLST